MDNKYNPYKRLTPEEIAQNEVKVKEREKLRKEVEELAKKCLHHEDFVKYKDKYLRLREVTVDSLIDYVESDPLRYAFTVNKALAKLYQLRLLLDGVSVDNRPRGKK